MLPRPLSSTRTDTLFPDTPLFRSSSRSARVGAPPCWCTPRPYLDRAVKRQSASGLGRSLGGRARLEDVLAVPAELFYRLADVVARSMGRGLSGHGFEGARIHAAAEPLVGGAGHQGIVGTVPVHQPVAGQADPAGCATS